MLLDVHSYNTKEERQPGWGGGDGRVNLKLQEAEATKIKILGVGVGAALDFITLDEGQRYSICLVL